MHVIHRRAWELPEHLVTAEHVFFNRRKFMAAAAASAFLPGVAHANAVLLNPKFQDAGRPVTSEETNTNYNNFYEFGSSKRISSIAESLVTKPWSLTIDGEVEAPQTLDIDDLMKQVTLEQRIVRHRCVEAWSMVVPWTGFPLSQLVAIARPKADAKYLRFETFNNPDMAPGQKPGFFSSYPWPYVEGLTMAEAMNELAFMVTGAYGKDLPKSMGAPIRLHTPWKYGFKSIKSVVRLSFTKERPVSFWEQLGPQEYGFWANVNPDVSHPRWSQASEEVLDSGERVPTLLFNGYGEFVAHLYKDMQNEPLWM